MKPIGQQKILQIEWTNACPHRCASCTRLNAHVRKPYFTSFEQFKTALASVRDFPGLIGAMGGEPVLHPEFERFCEHFAATVGGPVDLRRGVEPIIDFNDFRIKHLAQLPGPKRGLWSSLGKFYYQHYETIMKTFQYQCINTHETPGLHQSILIASKELPIPEAERRANIDKCWVNQLWSASINPAGAYFCEVAAALDLLLFKGASAWRVESGWWKRPPTEWKSQLHLCDYCGAAQSVPRRQANQKFEDISPGMVELLKAAGSPRIERGEYKVFDVAGYDPNQYKKNLANAEWYLPAEGDNRQRVGSTNASLRPKKVELLMVCVGYADFLRATLAWNMKQFDRTVVVTSSDDLDTQRVVKEAGATLVISDRHKENGAVFNKGKLINEGFKALDFDDWVMLSDADILFMPDFRQEFAKRIWNPGVLYYGTRYNTPPNGILKWVERFKKNPEIIRQQPLGNPADNQLPWGYFQLFNCRAGTIRDRVKDRLIYPENFTTAGGVDKKFHEGWPANRKQLSPPDIFKTVHMYHGRLGTNWAGRRSRALVNHRVPDAELPPLPPNGWRIVGWVDEKGYNFATEFPANQGYVKLLRTDTGEFVIGRNVPAPRGELVRSVMHHGAHHFGLVSNSHALAVDRKNRGKVCLYKMGRTEYSGWGLGHTMWDDRQGYVWAGQAIKPCTLEVYWKQVLNEEDRRGLVLFNWRDQR